MNWFKNLKTVAKLMLAFGLMALIMAFVGYQGITGANTINTMLNTLYERHMLGISHIKEADIALMKVAREIRSMILEQDQGEMQRMARNIDTYFSAMEQDLSLAEKTLVSEEAKADMRQIREILPQYQSRVREIEKLTLQNKNKEAWEAMKAAATLANQMNAAVEAMSKSKESLGKQAYEESDVVYARLRTTLLAVLGSSCLLCLGLGYIIAQLITKPLRATVGVLEKVAQGDLTARLAVDTQDEVGQMAESLNRATEAMHTALNEVRTSAESMASSAQELASASEELASGAQEQAASLEETTATLEQITSTVKQNADNANQANQFANGSRESAEKGGAVVTEAVAAMGQINEASKDIAEIITTIDEIAFQTNLLALNAAVEAARAGEQGRGFAVVATEVRNLAQRSATSAKEIKRLIQDSVRRVENGSELVNKSGDTLQEIVTSVKRVTDVVAEIAAASREQSTGIEQVNKAMIQMDQVTQTNSSQTEELSATAQSLAAHAQQLQALVARFHLEGAGAIRQNPAQPAAQSVIAVKPVRKAGHASPLSAAHKIKPNGHDTSEASVFQEF